MDAYNRSEKRLKSQKKYEKSEKGKIAIKRKQNNRYKRFKEAIVEISLEEIEAIKQFYKDCPEGYEVDHIIPIAKGGLHILSNLRYLTKSENRRLNCKLNEKYNPIYL